MNANNLDVLWCGGSFPKKQLKMMQAWIAVHEDKLMAGGKLALLILGSHRLKRHNLLLCFRKLDTD
jgi:hypothetical protein